MIWKRHTLIDVSDAGREAILAELAGNGPDSAPLREKLGRILLPDLAGARVPGVVRREDFALRPGYLPLGFSEPVSNGQERMRIGAFARFADIRTVTSPYEIALFPAPRRTACTDALASTRALADSLDLAVGVWGSMAMELYTGLPCIREGSDLDLIVAAAPEARLSRLLNEIKDIEATFNLRVDVELDLPNGYGVQLKELFTGVRTVLGKSTTDVALLPHEEIMAGLPHDSCYTEQDPLERLLADGGRR